MTTKNIVLSDDLSEAEKLEWLRRAIAEGEASIARDGTYEVTEQFVQAIKQRGAARFQERRAEA